jgi:hypothetical protein
VGVVQEIRGLLQRSMIRVVALSCMLTGMTVLSLDGRLALRDPDNWWHIRVGDWILQNHAFPRVGLFSRTAGDQAWMAYSWGYEILLSLSYRAFGLIGVSVFGILLTLLVASVVFWMSYRLSGKFWLAWSLGFIGCFAFLFKLLPRPVFFSMALFIITLGLILEAHRDGRIQRLYWLPPIFLLWANLHIQFIYGLFAFGLFCFTNLALDIAGKRTALPASIVKDRLPPGKLFLLLALCVVATCIGPYSLHLYEVILNYSKSRVAYAVINELQAPKFEYPTDYVLLLMTVAVFFVMGWRKKLDLFKLGLLVISCIFAFRAQRDVWFLGICAVAFLSDGDLQPDGLRDSFKIWEGAATGVIVVFLFALFALNAGLTTRRLDRAISSEYPVDAVNYLRRNPVAGPLYNDFGWGGFLIWYMPDSPVSIDGRTDLYGDEFTSKALRSIDGDYGEDAVLRESGVVLLNRTSTLAWKLAADPQYRVVYADKLAIVLVPVK